MRSSAVAGGSEGLGAKAYLLAAGYALTVFAGAFLLFQVEPLIAKVIVPWFGGCPSVWTTCMLVFQLLLFVGYAYAHATTRMFSPRPDGAAPGDPGCRGCDAADRASAQWKPSGEENPCLRIVLILLCSVGAPFFVLSSTGPLLQAWFSRVFPRRSPYRLYALSNAGSLLALMTYPFLVEPKLSVGFQTWGWSGMFLAYAVLCGAIAIASRTPRESEAAPADARRRSLGGRYGAESGGHHAVVRAGGGPLGNALGNHEHRVPGHCLGAFPVGASPGAVLGFLRAVFRRHAMVSPHRVWPGVAVAAGLAMVALNYGATSFLQIIALLLAMFAVAMFCHGELATCSRRRGF